jgi:photosystem II stability/assembly factor-like uncharacterized protein
MNPTKRVLLLVGISIFFLSSHSTIAQWVSQQVPSDAAMLLSVGFADSLRGVSSGWSLGFFGRAMYTADGGAHWQKATVPDSSRSLVTVQMINADTGYIAGAYNVSAGSSLHSSPIQKFSARRLIARGEERFLQRIGRVLTAEYRALFLRTTDGGRTWVDGPGVLPDSLGYLIGSSFVDSRTGYVTGDGLQSLTNVAILRTTDGGEHWSSMKAPDSVAALRSIRALDAGHAIAVGYEQRGTVVKGVILATTNAGATWTEQIFPDVDNFTDVSFSNALTGYAVGVSAEYRGIVLKTTNGGGTWEPQLMPADTMLLHVVRFLEGTDEGFVVGERFVRDINGMQVPLPAVMRTTDGGLFWSEEVLPELPSWTLLVGGELISHEQAYLSGGDGTLGALLRFGKGGTVSGGIAENKPPVGFSLNQNYPNPFNPLTIVKYTVGGNRDCQPASGLAGGRGVSDVSLIVYDVLGRTVAALVNEKKAPGNYEARFDGSGLASGVYIYRLSAGSFVQSRRMMLVK